jgi:pimeloyl-ACP methyl ester carboxylesterase
MHKFITALRLGALGLLLALHGPHAFAGDAVQPDTGRAIVRDLQALVQPGAVDDQLTLPIGGVPQWVHVRGRSKDNPLLLFVHGGPASPMSPTAWEFQRPLEEYFTVVQWDQRGAGKSYALSDPDKVRPTLKLQRYVDDAIELSQALLKRYGKKKLILVGHSWGSIVGLRTVQQRPDLFYAYVGTGQVINGRENERISFEYGLAQARAAGNEKAVREMEAIAPYPGDRPLTRARIIVARKWPQYYGGLSAFRQDSMYYFDGGRLSPDYTNAELANIDKGSLLTLDRLLDDIVNARLDDIQRLDVPVFMLLGRHDYTTPTAPVLQWLDQLQAPAKQVVFFEQSAHMVPWEEPGKFLVTLLQQVRPLAQ